MRNFSVNSIRITGVIPSYAFQRAKYLVLELRRSMPLCFPEPEIEGVLEMEWYRRLTEWRHVYGSEIWSLRRPVAVFLDGKFIGSDVELLKLTSICGILLECVPMRNSTLMKRKLKEDYLAHLKSTKLNYCYFDICVDDNFVGTLVFQLHSNILPKTCENFTTLCLGSKGDLLSYKGTRIHRIVKNGWLQGGDNQYKTGGGGFNVYCSPLQDECYGISHDRRGILSMANSGKHTNGSQFFITLNPSTWMDTYFVAFGQLIKGVNVLNLIENIDTFREFPLRKIEIKNCGKLNLEDVNDVDAKYREDLRDAAPKKRPKKIEKIADQVARLVMEAVTERLAAKERMSDVTHVDDVPSGMNIHLYFQGFYSLPSEVLEESAKYLRNLRRELLRHLRPSATEVIEAITYDLMGAVFTKYIDLDDVRETAGHSVYQRLIEGIYMKLEMIDKPYVKKFVNQLVTTAETAVKLISTKLNWMRRNKLKTRIFQDKMNEWIKSFVLQETFEDDSFRIAERSQVPPKKSPCEDETPQSKTRTKHKKHVCGCEETAKKEHKPVGICCNGKDTDADVMPGISQYFNSCLYDFKRRKRSIEERPQVLNLIELCRYQLRILRNEDKRRRSSERMCLEVKIKQWMKDVAYISETEWIRQTIFADDHVCLNHTEEIMYGAMTIGLIEMYYLMEEYLKRPKRRRYRTRVIYPEDDDSFSDKESIPDNKPAAAESSYSDSQESIQVSTSKKGEKDQVSQDDKNRKPCSCGDICCDCTFEPRNDDNFSAMDDEVMTDNQVIIPPTPPPSLEVSDISEGKSTILEFGEESSCTEIPNEIDVEQLMAQVTGKSADKINLKSFKWLQEYILEKSCQLKSDFAGQVHSWLDTHMFNYQGILSKHSLVTRASLLSFSFSLAGLLKEENNLKSELKDFVYDLWELYFKEMFKEALMEHPPKAESVGELKPESVKPETHLPEVEEKEYGDSDESCSKVQLLVKGDFDFDKFCREKGETNGEPVSVVPETPLPAEDFIHELQTEEELKGEKKFKKSTCAVIIRELIKSSEEIRSSSQYTMPLWLEFLGEITKRSLGLIAELSRLPRRLYFSSESQTSFDDKIKSWIEFNNFSSSTTGGKDVRDFIAEHHVSIENLDETARSFMRRKIIWDSIDKSSRPSSSEVLAEELVLDLIMKAVEKVGHGEDDTGKLSREILQSLIRSATIISTETLQGDVSSREDTMTTIGEYSENDEDLVNDRD